MSIFAKMPGRICIFACDPIQSYDLVCVLLQHKLKCPATCVYMCFIVSVVNSFSKKLVSIC